MKSKQELLEEVTKLKMHNEKWRDCDRETRQEFAKAFDWYSTGLSYARESTADPSWEQIFVKVGRLLATDKEAELEKDSQRQCAEIDILRQKIEKLTKHDVTPF